MYVYFSLITFKSENITKKLVTYRNYIKAKKKTNSKQNVHQIFSFDKIKVKKSSLTKKSSEVSVVKKLIIKNQKSIK